MSKTFKWNMFFTSFLPLWISIIVFDIWNIACFALKYRAIDPKWYENTLFIFRNVAIESITRKKIPEKAKTIVSLVGMALLFALMIFIVVKDVIGLF